MRITTLNKPRPKRMAMPLAKDQFGHQRIIEIEEVREARRLKSIFLEAIAHDCRTPLTSIKAAATSLLGDTECDERQRRELLVVIDQECDRIDRVVSQVIDLARLDANEIELEFARHSVSELVCAALRDCEVAQGTRIIRTELAQPEIRIQCDLFWARKVLVHLVQNATLYSSPGEPITIESEQTEGFVRFHIADSGPGIEEGEISQIFEKFYRGKSQRHRVPGTGMGLAIAKGIVEAHGGNIDVTSKVGKGSVFTFSLPIERRQDSRPRHCDTREV